MVYRDYTYILKIIIKPMASKASGNLIISEQSTSGEHWFYRRSWLDCKRVYNYEISDRLNFLRPDLKTTARLRKMIDNICSIP